jgi:hypothetical protein
MSQSAVEEQLFYFNHNKSGFEKFNSKVRVSNVEFSKKVGKLELAFLDFQKSLESYNWHFWIFKKLWKVRVGFGFSKKFGKLELEFYS